MYMYMVDAASLYNVCYPDMFHIYNVYAARRH